MVVESPTKGVRDVPFDTAQGRLLVRSLHLFERRAEGLRVGGNNLVESGMKVRAFFRFGWFRDWVMKVREQYLNWKVRRAW